MMLLRNLSVSILLQTQKIKMPIVAIVHTMMNLESRI